MLDFHQHIGCTTKGIDTLGHCYTPFKNGYRAKVLHTFRKSNHLSEVKTVDILIFWCPHHRKPDLGTVYWLERWEMQGRDCFTSDAWGNSCYPLKILRIFYSSIIENVLTVNITAWYETSPNRTAGPAMSGLFSWTYNRRCFSLSKGYLHQCLLEKDEENNEGSQPPG